MGILTKLFCTSGPNLLILAPMGNELWCGQAQNGLNSDFKVKFDLEGQGQLPHFGPNLVILAWTGLELSCGQASDYCTHGRTHRQTQATTIPKGQNWPRVKNHLENPRSRSWVRSKFKVTTMWVRQPIDSHPFRSMSIWHPIAELRLFQNLTLKFKGQGHRWGHSSKSQYGYNILSTHIPLICSMSIGHSIPELWLFSKVDLENQRSKSWVSYQFKVTMWV